MKLSAIAITEAMISPKSPQDQVKQGEVGAGHGSPSAPLPLVEGVAPYRLIPRWVRFAWLGTPRFLTVALVISAILFMAATFTISILSSDGFYSVLWTREFADTLSAGIWLPRFIREGFAGLGSPTFYFYPPVPYYLTAPLYLIAGSMLSPVRIMLINALLFDLLSFGSMWYLLRTLRVDRRMVWQGSLLYAVAPFRLFMLFTRGAMSVHVAFIFLPIVVAGVLGLALDEGRDSQRRAALSLIVGWVLLMLTSVPVAMTVGIAITALVVVLARSRAWRPVRAIVVALSIGTLLTLFHFLPAALLSRNIQVTQLGVSRVGDLDALGTIDQLFSGIDLTGNFQTLLNYGLLLIATVATTLGLRRSESGRPTLMLKVLLPIAWCAVLFQNTSLTGSLWRLLRMTTTVQFVWRWDSIGLVLLILFWVLARDATTQRRLRYVMGVAVGCSVFLLTLLVFNLRVHPRAPQRTPFDPPEYASAFGSHDSSAVVTFVQAHANDPFVSPSRKLGAEEFISKEIRGANASYFTASLLAPTEVTLHSWYWPDWAMVDRTTGRALQLHPDHSGRATVTLPSGDHRYQYILNEDPSEIIGGWISLGTLALLMAGVLASGVRSRTGRSRTGRSRTGHDS